jgi:hypothetical protein
MARMSTDTIPKENIPEETVFLAPIVSPFVKSATSLFLIPLPIPKSKFNVQDTTDKIVNQIPSMALSEKYLIYKGVARIETRNAPPLTMNA